MKKGLLPFNITLYQLTPERLRLIREVSTLDVLDGPGGNFHEDGLFSISTFGRVGSAERARRFGYIDLKVPILHPIVYNVLTKLKGLYTGIMNGTQYAKWNPETLDFDVSNELEGRTGYFFFLEHLKELDPPKTDSFQRGMNLSLLNKYRNHATTTKLLVMPAGLRDANIGSDGRIESDETNELYQNILMQARNIPAKTLSKDELVIYDRTAHTLVQRVRALYLYLENLISGKKGMAQNRYASRRVFNGTRNVISSQNTSVKDFSNPHRPRFNDTVIGVYQAARSYLPKTIHGLMSGIAGEVFNTGSNTVELVDPETLNRSWVTVSNADMDRWTSPEGLDRLINEISVIENRNSPVMIAGNYLALVYLDDKGRHRIMRDIGELPEGFDRVYVRPLTFIELIYMALPVHRQDVYGFVTRFPIENQNSSYPTRCYVKSTERGIVTQPLNSEWEVDGNGTVYGEYPTLTGVIRYFDAMNVNPSRLKSLGADFDGDMCSFNSVYTDESLKEAREFFRSWKAYLNTDGDLAFSSSIDTVAIIMRFLAGKVAIKDIEKKILAKRAEIPAHGSRDPNSVYVDQYQEFADRAMSLVAYNPLLVYSATPKSLKTHPDSRRVRKELVEKYKDELNNPAIIAKIGKTLEEMDREWLKDDPIADFYAFNEHKLYGNVRKKMYGTFGGESPFQEGTTMQYIEKSLQEGLDLDQLVVLINSLRYGSFNRGEQTKLGGESVKTIYRMLGAVTVIEGDCGSKNGLTLKLLPKGGHRYIGRHVIQGSKTIEITSGNLGQFIGKTITIRSPRACIQPGNNVCSVCIGAKLANQPDGLASAAANMGGRFLALFLALMHGKVLATTKWDMTERLS